MAAVGQHASSQGHAHVLRPLRNAQEVPAVAGIHGHFCRLQPCSGLPLHHSSAGHSGPLIPRRAFPSRPRAAADDNPVSFGDDGAADVGAEVLFPPSAPPPPPSGSPSGPGGGLGLGPLGSASPEAPQEVQLVLCLQSEYCAITVLEFPDDPVAFGPSLAGCRILSLDATANVSSVYHPTRVWTQSYWDDMALVAAASPPRSSVAVLGLAGGSVARIICNTRPDLRVEGWEIDGLVVQIGRDFFGMAELEHSTAEGGGLTVHIGDAFEAVAAAPQGFSCIIVDLFLGGQLAEKLRDGNVWTAFRGRLAPQGRMVVNCGGPSLEPSLAAVDEPWQTTVATMHALLEAFPGEAQYKSSDEQSEDANYLVMVGPPIEQSVFEECLPREFLEGYSPWKPLTEKSPCLVR